MTAALTHRGPDDVGEMMLANGHLALGHRRLSILDLSALGHQPMGSDDGRCWIVFNGEIYNFREVRAELEQHGFRFRSESDTEVILAAYRHWGLEAVSRFRGMFAFALWDRDTQSLHLCRDRFGVKPLYYELRDGQLAFGSQLRALQALRRNSADVDAWALAEFLQVGYSTAPRTILRGVRAVRPGTICTFGPDLHLREVTFWSTRDLFGAESEPLRTELAGLREDTLLERMEVTLQKAFEYRMVADVPVGLFLSGGIDSSLVAALLTRRSGLNLRTFTIGYGGSDFDETCYARGVASALGTEHTEFAVSDEEALRTAVEIAEVADEPIGDSSLIPTLLVSRLARQHVKVALSADGADELFGGYARYDHCGRYLQRSGRLSRALYRLSAEMLERMPTGLVSAAYRAALRGGPGYAAISDKLRKFVRMTRSADAFDTYMGAVSEWSTRELEQLLGHSVADLSEARRDFSALSQLDPRLAMMHFDLVRYLPGDLLTKVDRASMAVSLEAREPFLDHEAARLAAALPMEWKIRGRENKYILRRLLERYVPRALFDRPKKGFSAPIGEWLRGPLRPMLLEELSVERVRQFGLLDARVVHGQVTRFLDGHPRRVSPAAIWILLQLQRWAGRWLAAPGTLAGRPIAPESLSAAG